MNSKQMDALRVAHGIAQGEEWSTHSGFSRDERVAVDLVLNSCPLYKLKETYGSKVSPEGKRDYQHLADTFDIPGCRMFVIAK